MSAEIFKLSGTAFRLAPTIGGSFLAFQTEPSETPQPAKADGRGFRDGSLVEAQRREAQLLNYSKKTSNGEGCPPLALIRSTQ